MDEKKNLIKQRALNEFQALLENIQLKHTVFNITLKPIIGEQNVKDYLLNKFDELSSSYFKEPKTSNIGEEMSELMFKATDNLDWNRSKSYWPELLNKHISSVKSYQKKNFQSDEKYPNPIEIAGQYHIEKGSKHKQYTAEQIAPVMEVTKTYIGKNPDIPTIHGHIKTVIGKCKGLTGGREAKSNWIKFYAEKAGLETI